jgi:hypothetical protein
VKLRLALIFCAALSVPADPPPAPRPALDEFTKAKLAEALACVNLTTDDLGWNKRPIDDDFRLKCVNDTLDRPLELAAYAERAEREFAADPEASVRAGAAWIDQREPRAKGERPEFTVEKDYPEDARLLLAILWSAGKQAKAACDLAEAALSDPERTTLRGCGAQLYTEESEEPRDPKPVLAVLKKVDIAAYFDAALVLAQAARELRATAPAAMPAWKTHAESVFSVGGPGADVHRKALFVVDAGGDDLFEDCAFVFDLGGDDTYRRCGSGDNRPGLIVDLAGNDRYLDGNIAQGGAAFGAALLVDVSGDDQYVADQCSQGSGICGVGMLFDLAGNDSYRGARFVQGFGGIRGLGVLSDVAGNDTYWAGGKYSHAPLLPENFQSLSQGFGFGLRPDASGGVGILADHAGNDVYAAEVFGQGCSYWYALGVLVDGAGHDKYVLHHYGQGSGIHLSSGVLLDRAGNDAYSVNNGVGQGCGHDWASGMLLDLDGNDYYQGSGLAQGGANANGCGIFIDRRGNDSHAGIAPQIQGFSFPSRGTFGLGVMLDLGGQDKYTEGGSDDATWTKSHVGVGLDCEEEK